MLKKVKVLLLLFMLVNVVLTGCGSKDIDGKVESNIVINQEESNSMPYDTKKLKDKLTGSWFNSDEELRLDFHPEDVLVFSNGEVVTYKILDDYRIEITNNDGESYYLDFLYDGETLSFKDDIIVRVEQEEFPQHSKASVSQVKGIRVKLPTYRNYGFMSVTYVDNKHEAYIVKDDLSLVKIDIPKLEQLVSTYEHLGIKTLIDNEFIFDKKGFAEITFRTDKNYTRRAVINENYDVVIEPMFNSIYSGLGKEGILTMLNIDPELSNFFLCEKNIKNEYGEDVPFVSLYNREGQLLDEFEGELGEDINYYSSKNRIYLNGYIYDVQGQKKPIPEEVQKVLDRIGITSSVGYENGYFVVKLPDMYYLYTEDLELINTYDPKLSELEGPRAFVTKDGKFLEYGHDGFLERKTVEIDGNKYQSLWPYSPIKDIEDWYLRGGYKIYQRIRENGEGGYCIITDLNDNIVIGEDKHILWDKLSNFEPYASFIKLQIRELDENNNKVKDHKAVWDKRTDNVLTEVEFINKIGEKYGIKIENESQVFISY